jgi:uncharacterized membrane protein
VVIRRNRSRDSLVGVIGLSVTRPTEGFSSFVSQLFGIASGALFGVAAVTVRAASLSLEGSDFVIRAGFSLRCVLASIGWFTAMTLENAAYVRGLGQIELVFTFVASYLFFGERASRREIVGILLVVMGILLLVRPS